MKVVEQPLEKPHDAAEGTLGALLYADKTRARVPEADWLELVRGIAAGDQNALRALYDRTQRLVFTLSMRITHKPEIAEEVTIDVFHDVWRRAAAYDPSGGSVVGWIMNQTRSRAIDRLRFEQRKKRVDGGSASPMPVSPSARDPHEELGASEQRRTLRDALAVLTNAERLVIESAFFAELTYSEVATRLNEPLGTVKTRARSGLEKLRQKLAVPEKEP